MFHTALPFQCTPVLMLFLSHLLLFFEIIGTTNIYRQLCGYSDCKSVSLSNQAKNLMQARKLRQVDYINSAITQLFLKLMLSKGREKKRRVWYFSTLALCIIRVAEHQGWNPGPCKISGNFAIDFNRVRILPWVSTAHICIPTMKIRNDLSGSIWSPFMHYEYDYYLKWKINVN